MKKKLEILGKSLTKGDQRNINGGLPYNCWCLTPVGLDCHMKVYYNQPCGQPGQYVVCRVDECAGEPLEP